MSLEQFLESIVLKNEEKNEKYSKKIKFEKEALDPRYVEKCEKILSLCFQVEELLKEVGTQCCEIPCLFGVKKHLFFSKKDAETYCTACEIDKKKIRATVITDPNSLLIARNLALAYEKPEEKKSE